MNIKIYENPPEYDSDDITWIIDGKEVGKGFIARDDKSLHIMRCPKCDKENYAMAVSTGQCAWCGFDANK